MKPWHRNSLLLLLLCAIPAITAAQEGKYVGRPVADVLRELQSDRLRIIFSSDLVPPSLSVKAEPKGRNPRELAQQILASHGLTLQKGPGDTWIVVARSSAAERQAPARRPPPAPPKPPPTDPAKPPGPGPMRIDEQVEVIERLRETGGSPTAYALEPSAVRDAAGGFENVFQVLQVLPGAAGINDEDGKIAVRGGGPEHNLIVVDGIQIHRPQRLGDFMGSFVNPATIKSVSLDASGLEARYGGRLSSVTTIDTRDGATDRALAVSGALGLTSGDALLEGRLPGTESGSWWVTARGTYYRLLLDRLNKEVKPGFEDLQFKVTARPSPKTRLTFFGLAGRETHGTVRQRGRAGRAGGFRDRALSRRQRPRRHDAGVDAECEHARHDDAVRVRASRVRSRADVRRSACRRSSARPTSATSLPASASSTRSLRATSSTRASKCIASAPAGG